MKNFICEMFYKQRTEFERSYGFHEERSIRCRRMVSLQSDIFYD